MNTEARTWHLRALRPSGFGGFSFFQNVVERALGGPGGPWGRPGPYRDLVPYFPYPGLHRLSLGAGKSHSPTYSHESLSRVNLYQK